MVHSTPTRITAHEFLQRPETTQITELIDGAVIVSPSPVFRHQRIVGNLYMLLRGIVPNGEVAMAPMDVHLDETNVVQPDVLWIADNSRAHIDQWVMGAPDLVIEVLSPATAEHDRTAKLTLYEQSGVREYWLIDPDDEQIEVRILGSDGAFVLQGIFTADDPFISPVVGKSIPIDVVFA